MLAACLAAYSHEVGGACYAGLRTERVIPAIIYAAVPPCMSYSTANMWCAATNHPYLASLLLSAAVSYRKCMRFLMDF